MSLAEASILVEQLAATRDKAALRELWTMAQQAHTVLENQDRAARLAGLAVGDLVTFVAKDQVDSKVVVRGTGRILKRMIKNLKIEELSPKEGRIWPTVKPQDCTPVPRTARPTAPSTNTIEPQPMAPGTTPTLAQPQQPVTQAQAQPMAQAQQAHPNSTQFYYPPLPQSPTPTQHATNGYPASMYVRHDIYTDQQNDRKRKADRYDDEGPVKKRFRGTEYLSPE